MTLRVGACCIGQSNEAGSGVLRDRTTRLGRPTVDPVGPNGGSLRSMWPLLSDLLGARGVQFSMYNSSVGATSLAYSWCGYIKTWVTSMLVIKGSMVLSGGKTWLCTAASSTVNASTVAPAAGLQADGVTWSDLGASTGTDTVGLCGPTHARFDPNGYVVAAYNGVANMLGQDEKRCLISIGQGDKSMSVVRADFAQAIRNVTDYMLARSVKVDIGFTCYGNTAGLVSWMDTELIPGWSDAVASYAGNPNVMRGANLATSIGALASTSSNLIPGLQAADDLHMNDPMYALASIAWRDAYIAGAGW